MTTPTYPEIVVTLGGNSGAVEDIIYRCQIAMKEHKLPQSQLDKFSHAARSGDAQHTLSVCRAWFTIK